jgi:serine/threonine-protein kinase
MPELLGRLQSALADRYRLDREAGAGGMATVYLAEDVRHDRRVALKVLRPELAAVIGAERFLAEIKLTANLQHPHILPLFESGEADGYLFYVMPFVEGETLRDRINREKQLPVAEAVRITTEVASALDYAHRHGVVHRDIKPENILLHDGQALVADFGIALAASKAGGSRMTETGMSLGTPHYMSPEQAMGEREITARSDVYALGAVLYEMLTGEPPFTGHTAQAVVARVLTESPRPLGVQRHTIPRHVEAAVLTALEKLPADRFATAAEFADALRDRTYSSAAAIEAAPAPAAAAPVARGRMRRPVVPVLLGLLAVAMAIAVWGWLRPAPAIPVTQFALALRSAEALAPPSTGGGARVAISPDGRTLVYTGPGDGAQRLWLRRLDQLAATPIAGTEGAASPFFSPDGRRIGFIKSGTTVRIASLDGAPTVTLTDKANSTSGDWSDDDWIYFEVDSGVARLRPTGAGTPELVHKIDQDKNEVGAEWPFALPGGKGILVRTRRAGQGAADYDIVAVKGPGAPRHVLTHGIYARYAAGRLFVVTADGKLIAIPFDTDKLELNGAPTALLDGIGVRTAGFNVDFSLSHTGTLVYTSGSTLGSRRPVWLSREGQAAPVDASWDPQGLITNIALSPDGRQLAVELTRNGKADIWVKQLPTGPFSRITFGDTAGVRPAWSPDGRDLYFVRDRGGTGVGPLFAHRADGTGADRQLIASRADYGQIVPSRDGRWLVTRTPANTNGGGDILGFHAGAGDSTPVMLVATAATELFPSLSPDGRWLAYSSNESGTPEVYVRPFPETASAKWQVSTAGGQQPLWAASGRELYYINGKRDMIAAQIHPGATFSVGEQKALFSTAPYTGGAGVHGYAVTADGKRFLVTQEGEPLQESELVVAQGWLQQLDGKGGK